MFVLTCINKSSKGKESNDDGGGDENDDELAHRVPRLAESSSYSPAL